MIPCFLVSSDSKMRENLPSNLSLYQSYFQNSFRLVLSRSVWSCCGFSGQCCGFGCGQNPGPRRVVPGRDAGEAPNRKGRRSRVGLASCCLYHFGVLFMPSFPLAGAAGWLPRPSRRPGGWPPGWCACKRPGWLLWWSGPGTGRRRPRPPRAIWRRWRRCGAACGGESPPARSACPSAGNGW